MSLEDMAIERLRETLLALRKAARLQAGGRGSYAHLKEYRAAFVRGIIERRVLLRERLKAR